MSPKISIVFFTCLSTLGFGLAIVLGTGHGNPAAVSTKLAWLLSIALIIAGMGCVLFSEGRWKRLWRKPFQRSADWLARAVVLSAVALIPLFILAALSLFQGRFDLRLGYVVAILSLLSVVSISKGYASQHAGPAMHSAWSHASLIGSAMAGGTIVYLSLFGHPPGTVSNERWVYLAIIFLLIGALLKFMWKRRLVVGAHEQAGPVIGPHERKRHNISLMLVLVLPISLLALSLVTITFGTALQIAAMMSFAIGLFFERWIFLHMHNEGVGQNEGEKVIQPVAIKR